MSKLCRTVSVLLLVLLIILYAPLTLPRLFGYECSAVVSASMEPAIKNGGLVYYKQCNPDQLKTGDIIVFRTNYGSDMTDVTHRIVENRKDAHQLITKGDANGNNDFSPAKYDLVKGVVVHSIPFGGKPALFLGSSEGKKAMLGILIPVVLFRLASFRYKDKKP